jgi:hypothetical protein
LIGQWFDLLRWWDLNYLSICSIYFFLFMCEGREDIWFIFWMWQILIVAQIDDFSEDALRLTRKCECGKHTFEVVVKKHLSTIGLKQDFG